MRLKRRQSTVAGQKLAQMSKAKQSADTAMNEDMPSSADASDNKNRESGCLDLSKQIQSLYENPDYH